MIVDKALPRNRKKLPLVEAFTILLNLVDIQIIKLQLIHLRQSK